MKICLVNPPITNKPFEGYEWTNNSFTVQHLGLGYIAGILKTHGYEVDIIECPGLHLDVTQLCDIIRERAYSMVGITTYFYNFVNVLRIVAQLRKGNRELFLFLGGYLPTLCCEMVLQKARGIDCCVLGEGELACLELVRALSDHRDWHHLESIGYLQNGQAVINPIRTPLKDLNVLPFPLRKPINPLFAPISTSRGCYGRCNYCGVREYYELCHTQAMRFRSPENVVDEIESVHQEFHPDLFLINDETFLSASKRRTAWLDRFCSLLEEKNLRIHFQALARANDLIANERILDRLQQVGLVNIFIGIESFVQRQLDYYRKLTTVEQNVKALEILKRNRFKVSIGLMLFDPYVTIEELLVNIRFLRNTDCCKIVDDKQALFSIDGPVIAIPGTAIYKELSDQGLLADNDIKYEFQDKDVQLCHKVLLQWERYVNPVSRYFYLLRIAEKYKPEELEILQEKKATVMEMDLNFFESLCQGIQKGTITHDNYQGFLLPWIEKAEMYRKEWEHMKTGLLKRRSERLRDWVSFSDVGYPVERSDG